MKKYKIYECEERPFGDGKVMKSMVLQGEGDQYTTKGVAIWSDHPDYASAKEGESFDWELKVVDSKNPNPKRPGSFYKNRSVMMPGEGSKTDTDSGLEARVRKLEQAVFADDVKEYPYPE